jgi:hypothetical protein
MLVLAGLNGANNYIALGAVTGALTNELITIVQNDGTLRIHGYVEAAGTISADWHYLQGNLEGTAWKVYLDGQLKPMATNGQTGVALSTGAAYVGSSNAPGSYFTGTLAETLWYNRVRSSSELATERRILRAKWSGRGISIP